MERVINQKDFNNLVIENIEEFSLDDGEAIEFAVEQLVAQGVNMSNIIAEIDVVRGSDPVSKFVVIYQDTKETDSLEVETFFMLLRGACVFAVKDIKHKLFAGKMNLHSIILNMLSWKQDDSPFVERALPHIIQIVEGYPDVVNESSITLFLYLFITHDSSPSIERSITSLLVESIKSHEGNKQILFKKKELFKVISKCIPNTTDDVFRNGCNIITNLSIDDDIRVEISNAHNRATALADEFLIPMFTQLKYWHGADVTSALLKAVTAVSVTNNLVMTLFKEDPEFKIVVDLMSSFWLEKDIMTNLMKMLVALSGNDECKAKMVPLIPMIIRVIDENMGSPPVIQSSLLLVSSLCLRSKPNALIFIQLESVEKIMQAMKHHHMVKLRRYGCMALRNMVASGKVVEPFEESGVEDFINDLLQAGDDLKEECKSVLVALGAPVVLTERWTGKRGDVVAGNEKISE